MTEHKKEKTFANWIWYNEKELDWSNWPWTARSLAIKPKEFIEFLKEVHKWEDDFVNLNINISQTSWKFYVELSNWKPDSEKKQKKEEEDDEF